MSTGATAPDARTAYAERQRRAYIAFLKYDVMRLGSTARMQFWAKRANPFAVSVKVAA